MPQSPASTLPRILLIEDHDMTRRMQIRFLSRNYAVDFASTGEEAIELAFERDYEAIVVDIGLDGGLTGLDVMQTLKHTPAHRGTAMVAVTGYASDADRERLTSAGFDLYLAKPFRWQEFTDVIHLAVRLTAEGSVQPAAPRTNAATAAYGVRPAVVRPASATNVRLVEAMPPRPAVASGDGLAHEVQVQPAPRLRPVALADLGSKAATASLPTWRSLADL